MVQVGIGNLKARLSQYLKRARAGEEVLITDRGRAVAKLAPVGPGDADAPPHLLDLERAGLARLGTGRLPPRFWSEVRPVDNAGLGVAALVAEREESRG